jgi:lipopolysaccharide/colanic/teichoic acid biosynthesis glycosyltransferase
LAVPELESVPDGAGGKAAKAPTDEDTRVGDGYKRAFDLTILVTSLVVLAPIWLLVCAVILLAIWLDDRGPLFYAQRRVGRGGREFTAFKFRTMLADAEKLTGPVWAAGHDPRTTRVGKVLRPLHLDEMPQLLNILMGDMSLVGPRPERPELVRRFLQEAPGFSSRLKVLPGLTGLAQVRGRYDLPPSDKLRYDNLYIRRLGPILDLKLLAITLFVVLIGRTRLQASPLCRAFPRRRRDRSDRAG